MPGAPGTPYQPGGGPSSSIDGYSTGRQAYNARFTCTGGAGDMLLEPNPRRLFAIIENRDDNATISIGLGVGASYTGAEGKALLPHESIVLEEIPGQERCEWTGNVRVVGITGVYVGVIEVSKMG